MEHHDKAPVSEAERPDPVASDAAEIAKPGLDRRTFFGVTGITTLGLAGVGLLGNDKALAVQPAEAARIEPGSDERFRERVFETRIAVAKADRDLPLLPHPTNGDEDRYENRIGSDTRALPHDERGEVDKAAYKRALAAYASGDAADFETIPLGGARKQLNPIGTLAVSLSGCAPVQFSIPPAPALASAERAAEAVEVFWQAILRDVPLTAYRNDTTNKDIIAAVDEIGRLPAYAGPKGAGGLTPETLFRGNVLYRDPADSSGRSGRYVTPPGVLDGPYISQFLLRDVAYGSQYLPATIRTAAPGVEYLTDYAEWLRVQNGVPPASGTKFGPLLRYIATGRDLAEYAHNNPAGFWAAALILGIGVDKTNPSFGGIGAPLNPSNPYLKSKTQTGASGTFALPYFQGLLPLATSRAVRVAYWNKFFVHRVLRPEAYGGLLFHKLQNKADDYPLHASIVNAKAVARSREKFGAFLLPQVYPEGSPIHSSYPGGASIIGAANVTLLKAFYDENFVWPNPVQPDPADPTKLVPYQGPPLTVGGELNKLSLNYGLGRNWAGIHWRSDLASAQALGEEVAIALLRDEAVTFREAFDGFSFTRFDGTKATISSRLPKRSS
jgi:hypothetical protein